MNTLIVANWKSHKTELEVTDWLSTFVTQKTTSRLAELERKVLIAPSFPFLTLVEKNIEQFTEALAVCSQDVSPFPFGAYTGAVAAAVLADHSVTYSIVGHSERRRYFHETNQEVANKVRQCLEVGVTPIVCVDVEYIASQASAIDDADRSKCVVAYEPLAAIGSGVPQKPSEVIEVVQKIHKAFGSVQVLYGGSVSVETVNSYLEITNGVLVGSASLDAEKFAQLATASGTQ